MLDLELFMCFSPLTKSFKFIFQVELDNDLPSTSPWKCPKCPYTANEPRALRVHYGVRHKVVLNHLASQLGINPTALKKEMKAGRKKAVSALKASITCRFCPMQFKSPPEHAKHTVMHLRNVLSAHLPTVEPWKCPRCEFDGPHHQSLLVHYGINHPNVVTEILHGDTSNLNIDMSFVTSAQTLQTQQQKSQTGSADSLPTVHSNCKFFFF